MKFKFFFVPVLHSEVAEAELNSFLSSTQVLSTERQFVDAPGKACGWAICVAWTEQNAGHSKRSGDPDRVDYRELLNDEDFSIFSELRELRKELAQQAGKPLYQVFSNKQLYLMVKGRISTEAELGKIEGVGQSRVNQFAQPFLQRLGELLPKDK